MVFKLVNFLGCRNNTTPIARACTQPDNYCSFLHRQQCCSLETPEGLPSDFDRIHRFAAAITTNKSKPSPSLRSFKARQNCELHSMTMPFPELTSFSRHLVRSDCAHQLIVLALFLSIHLRLDAWFVSVVIGCPREPIVPQSLESDRVFKGLCRF